MSDVSENIKALYSKMEEFITTKTVVGEPVQLGNVILVPLVDVTLGMGSGLGESDKKGGRGGGGFGAKITPAAVVVIIDGTVQLVNVKNQESTNKLIDMIPGILSKLNIGSLFEKKDKKDKDDELGPAETGDEVL
jgi:uncharacterized spore protein YtfJ